MKKVFILLIFILICFNTGCTSNKKKSEIQTLISDSFDKSTSETITISSEKSFFTGKFLPNTFSFSYDDQIEHYNIAWSVNSEYIHIERGYSSSNMVFTVFGPITVIDNNNISKIIMDKQPEEDVQCIITATITYEDICFDKKISCTLKGDPFYYLYSMRGWKKTNDSLLEYTYNVKGDYDINGIGYSSYIHGELDLNTFILEVKSHENGYTDRGDSWNSNSYEFTYNAYNKTLIYNGHSLDLSVIHSPEEYYYYKDLGVNWDEIINDAAYQIKCIDQYMIHIGKTENVSIFNSLSLYRHTTLFNVPEH